MSIPTGAHSVRYSFSVSGTSGDFDPHVEVNLTSNNITTSADQNAFDAALEAGADAIISSLQSQYPGSTVSGSRIYIGEIDGDPWP